MPNSVLIVTAFYPPEARSASDIMKELAVGLNNRGFNVTVITPYPRYNLPKTKKNVHYNSVTFEENVKVIRLKTLPHHKVNFIIRGISQLLMPFLFISKLLRCKIGKIDTVIVYSPPLPLAIVGIFVKYWYKGRFFFNVQDIFPQNAIDLGILKNKFAIKLFKYIEKCSYRHADVISVHSKSNANFINYKKKNNEDKIVVLHNWIDLKPFSNITTDNFFRKEIGFKNELVFLFAGVLGPSQGLDFLLDIANALRQNTDVCFLLAGDGMEKARLQDETKKRGLQNIVFMDYVSKEEYPKLISSVDVGLVCLSAKNKTPVVPGKILGYMAASKPVLAFLQRESDAHEVIKNAKCGYSSFSDDLNGSIAICKKMIEERTKLKDMGSNGQSFVNNNYELNKCLDLMIEHF